MKKLGAFLVTCFLGLTLTACSSTTAAPQGSAVQPDTGSGSAVIKPEIPEPGSSQGSGSAAENADPNVRTYRDCTITVIGYSLTQDINGDPALRIEYLFENKSKSAASFSTTVIPNAYQDETGTYDEPLAYTTPEKSDAAYSAMLTLIKPGETITCAGYYKLESTELPVYLKVHDLRDSTADALIRTFDIAGLSPETLPAGSAEPE
ncbi:MAG: DUF5067 domain-containing protein [Clostridia bacterium]|nr:DUF5067 domain-containing protein [Clostridia bacterium]